MKSWIDRLLDRWREPRVGRAGSEARRHVYLAGFMGAGKTTVGRRLARNLERPFLDLDESIESAAGCSISQIFADGGEARFRELEHQALKRAAEASAAVVATGGGVLVFDRNREICQRSGWSVWIDAPFQTVLARMQGREREKRPLFADEVQARSLYESRLPAYQRCDIRISVRSGESADDLAERIEIELEERI